MIRLLEKDSNPRGAVFARLVQDVFHTLGYHEFRLGTPRAGRELDLWANHRVEARSALAECKATKEPIGGDAINKFVGALQMERHEHPGREVTGYVVSLGGFRSSALAQEEALPAPRVILLSSADIERELVHARLIVSRDTAIAGAIACARECDRDCGDLDGTAELLAWEGGWVWCCRLARAGDPIGHVLVHADGQPLGPRAAAALEQKDAEVGGTLAQSTGLGPRNRRAAPAVAAVRAAYLAYVGREFGNITVDGLPADERVGAQKIGLEQLYVPLHVTQLAPPNAMLATALSEEGEHEDDEDEEYDEDEDYAEYEKDEGLRIPIGAVLARERSIAVLGSPGAGKSTLLKRLAVAYADPARRHEAADDLPEESWLPLVIRCRELSVDGDTTIRALLASLLLRAELEDPGERFADVVARALADGDALILIDGLDEIADDAARLRFVKQVRTFLGTYPTVRVVVTSREAGFRVVAGAVSDVCAHFRVAGFDRDDVVSLTRAWHRLVVGESQTVEQEATALALSVYDNARLRQLAINPLLLTTLLLVRRWVGELPRKRTVLYGKAIEVLLMTWNVEGHEPIDLEEAIPQLAYIAYSMTASERQSLSTEDMRRLLREAREELPEVLAYARVSPGTFIERVEERSSLISLSGHELRDGTLTALYEFKHLTFQEYLAAVACVEGFHPGARDGLTPLDLLAPRFDDHSWGEVIQLAIVLAGRRAAPLVEALCAAVEAGDGGRSGPVLMLAGALVDEAMIPPPLVDRACRALVDAAAPKRHRMRRSLNDVAVSRYGARLEEACADAYNERWSARSSNVGSLYSAVLFARRLTAADGVADDASERIEAELTRHDDARAMARGSLMLMEVAFGQVELRGGLARLAHANEHSLRSASVPTHYAAAWAYAWIGRHGELPADLAPRIAPRLFELWRAAPLDAVQRVAAWAFAGLPLSDGEIGLGLEGAALDAFLKEQWAAGEAALGGEPQREDRRPAALLLGRLAGRPWSAEQLARMSADINRPEIRDVPRR